MGIGKQIRMNRLFSHPSGRFFSVALDHFMGYDIGMPDGLRTIEKTLGKLVEAAPDAITINKGIVTSSWQPYAGRVPLIIQTVAGRPDLQHLVQITNVEEVVRMGADAVAVAIFVRGNTESAHVKMLAETIRDAVRFDLPVVTHVYPRIIKDGQKPYLSTEPEDIAWCVRCGVEAGADIVKVPYCGDVEAFRQIVSDCPVPVVAAGGPKTETMQEALQAMQDVIASGARGATVGRNIWGSPNVINNGLAYKAVIHDMLSPAEAVRRFGLDN